MWDVWGSGEGAGFLFDWSGGILVLFSSCSTSGGNTQLSPVFSRSCKRMGLSVFARLSLCWAEQWGSQGRAAVKQSREASLSDPALWNS